MDNQYHTFTGIPAGEIPQRLAEPFNDPKAYKGVPGGADLTDINTGHMLERITQVFGPKGPGWNFIFKPEDLEVLNPGEKRALARLRYAVFQYTLYAENGETATFEIATSGVNANSVEYAEEGARTSALGAAIKGLCFQLPVYKGQLDHHNAGKVIAGGSGASRASEPKTEPAKAPAAPKPASKAEPVPAPASGPAEPEPATAPHGNGGSKQPGEFVINVGAKYRGKKVSELADNVLGWFANLDGKGFAPQSDEGQAAQDACRRYLDLRQAAPA